MHISIIWSPHLYGKNISSVKEVNTALRIVDLFSGAGGLTFGFYYRLRKDGFVRNRKNTFVFANEFDKHAANAFIANYPDIPMLNCDIKVITEAQIKNLIGEDPVDIIIGGPPCQSFSTIGKRRFDDKAKLYIEYLRFLRIIRPKMFLFENVKGMLSMREQIPVLDKNGNEIIDKSGKIVTKPGRLIIDVIKEQFSSIDNNTGYTFVGEEVLDAVSYGVPQHRERVFLVGVRNDLADRVNWVYPPIIKDGIQTPFLTIREAICDLPELGEGQTVRQYTTKPLNPYQTLMRGKCIDLTLHYCGKHSEKLRRIIAAVPQGKGRRYINMLVDNGELPEFCRLTSGYDNTYGRLVENKPSTTITNNMCTPSGLRCIHYIQNRELSPREGARIQSFPDWFIFSGEKANVTTQIGNAVPPLLAIQMARQIEKVLKACDNG